tara:strand:- start:118 stop:798 length:681 start_codon:yes stop_codon:yes gene_type:complete
MKQGIRISVNQLATFVLASQPKKQRIIHQQKNPSTLIVSWYGKAKSVMRSFYKDPMNIGLIETGLKELKETKPKSKWQVSNRQGSIEILERFIKMQVPKCFEGDNVEFVKPSLKSLSILGVEIIASPELIFCFHQDGKLRYGAVKFHTSKSGKFTREQSKVVAAALKLYLKRYIAEFDPEAEVAYEYCLSVDVFNEAITNAGGDLKDIEKTINEACHEVIKLWNAA